MWHFIREIQERLSIEPHNYVRFALWYGENIRGDFGNVSGILIYAYRRRCRRRRRAPPRAVRSPPYFRTISRRLTRLWDHM